MWFRFGDKKETVYLVSSGETLLYRFEEKYNHTQIISVPQPASPWHTESIKVSSEQEASTGVGLVYNKEKTEPYQLETDLQHRIKSLLIQVSHDVCTDVVHGRPQGFTCRVKHGCYSNSIMAPLVNSLHTRNVCQFMSSFCTTSLPLYAKTQF